MKKAKRGNTLQLSPPPPKQASDVTLFLAAKDNFPDVKSATISPNEGAVKVGQNNLEYKDSGDTTGCVFHRVKDMDVATSSLIKAIESEINKHAAEVKRLSNTKHFSASEHKQGRNTKTIQKPSHVSSKHSDPQEQTKPEENHVPNNHINHRKQQRPLKQLTRREILKKNVESGIKKQLQLSESILTINPFKVNKNLDLLEMRALLQQTQTSKPEEFPIITDKNARIQYQVFNDNRLQVPVFNFRRMAYLPEESKRAQYDQAKSGPSFRFRDVNQLLSATRTNRKMHQETKWDIVSRIRNMNQCSISLAIKRRMIEFLNESVQKFDHDITIGEIETEDIAKEFDAYLRQSDEKTINSIHRAEKTQTERITAEQLYLKVQIHNNLLVCHNLRSEENIKMIDRFINAVYTIIPETLQTELLRKQQEMQKRHQEEKEAKERSGMWHFERPFKAVEESLQIYHTLSEESEAGSSDNHQDSTDDDESYEVPPVPLSFVSDMILQLTKNYTASQAAFSKIAETRLKRSEIQETTRKETAAAENKIKSAETLCQEKEHEIKELEEKIQSLKATNKLFKDGQLNRENFRQPITFLQDRLTEICRQYCNTTIPTYEQVDINVVLSALSSKLGKQGQSLRSFPRAYITKWYATVDKNRLAEERIVNELIRKAKRNQMLYEHINMHTSPQYPKAPRRRDMTRSFTPLQKGKQFAMKQQNLLEILVEKLEAEKLQEAKVAAADHVSHAEIDGDPNDNWLMYQTTVASEADGYQPVDREMATELVTNKASSEGPINKEKSSNSLPISFLPYVVETISENLNQTKSENLNDISTETGQMDSPVKTTESQYVLITETNAMIPLTTSLSEIDSEGDSDSETTGSEPNPDKKQKAKDLMDSAFNVLKQERRDKGLPTGSESDVLLRQTVGKDKPTQLHEPEKVAAASSLQLTITNLPP